MKWSSLQEKDECITKNVNFFGFVKCYDKIVANSDWSLIFPVLINFINGRP